MIGFLNPPLFHLKPARAAVVASWDFMAWSRLGNHRSNGSLSLFGGRNKNQPPDGMYIGCWGTICNPNVWRMSVVISGWKKQPQRNYPKTSHHKMWRNFHHPTGMVGQEVPMVHDEWLEIQYNNRLHGLNSSYIFLWTLGCQWFWSPKKTRGPPGILHPPPALGSYDMGRMKF
jgi:hypothetical protein